MSSGGDFDLIGESEEVALQKVIKTAHIEGNLVKGLNNCLRSIEKKDIDLCILAENCSAANYKEVVTALCKENGIPIIKHPDNMKLGEMCGLCKFDTQGNPRKVVSCSVAAIQGFNDMDINEAEMLRVKYIGKDV